MIPNQAVKLPAMKLKRSHFQRGRPQTRLARKGVAVVEFAVCLPIIMLIVFGAIQTSQLIMIRHKAMISLESAAIEYALRNFESEGLSSRVEALANQSGLRDAVCSAQILKKRIQLTLEVPTSSNCNVPQFVFQPPTVSAKLVIYRHVE